MRLTDKWVCLFFFFLECSLMAVSEMKLIVRANQVILVILINIATVIDHDARSEVLCGNSWG